MTKKEAIYAKEKGCRIVYHDRYSGDSYLYDKITEVRIWMIEGHDNEGRRIRGHIISILLSKKNGQHTLLARARDCSIYESEKKKK